MHGQIRHRGSGDLNRASRDSATRPVTAIGQGRHLDSRPASQSFGTGQPLPTWQFRSPQRHPVNDDNNNKHTPPPVRPAVVRVFIFSCRQTARYSATGRAALTIKTSSFGPWLAPLHPSTSKDKLLLLSPDPSPLPSSPSASPHTPSSAIMVASLATGALAVLACSTFATASPKVVSMPMGRVKPRAAQPLQKRGAQSVTLTNALNTYGLYYVNATVGTPGQSLAFQLDTGSSDVWMFNSQAYQSCLNSQYGAQCFGGSFSPSQSSSYTQIGQSGEFQIQYETPGSGVSGNYFLDDLSVGNIKLTNLTMALATQANQTFTGIMGIAFASDESIVSNANTQPYQNIIDVMLDQGVINTKAYSLYLDDENANTGSIIFGGYDSDKYTGNLTWLDIQIDSQTGVIDSFAVAWSAMAVSDSSGSTLLSSSFPQAAVLDSGTTLTVIPQDLFNQMANYFGAQNTQTYGYIVACSIGNQAGSIDFVFGGDNGPYISVPFSEFALPLLDTNGQPITDKNGNQICQFGMDVASQGTPILLGDTFLRSAYVVYDLTNKQIAIANANWGSKTSHLVELNNGTSPISGASTAAGATVSQTATVGAGGGGSGSFESQLLSDLGFTLSGTATGSAGASTVSGQRTSFPTGLGIHGVTGSLEPGATAGSGSGSSGSSASSTSSKGAAASVMVPGRGLPSLTMVAGSLAALLVGFMLTIVVM